MTWRLRDDHKIVTIRGAEGNRSNTSRGNDRLKCYFRASANRSFFFTSSSSSLLLPPPTRFSSIIVQSLTFKSFFFLFFFFLIAILLDLFENFSLSLFLYFPILKQFYVLLINMSLWYFSYICIKKRKMEMKRE